MEFCYLKLELSGCNELKEAGGCLTHSPLYTGSIVAFNTS